MQIQLPGDFNVEWMLNRLRTSSYGVLYRFTGDRVLRRPLWLAGSPVVVEFDLRRAGKLGLRLASEQRPAVRPRIRRNVLLVELASQVRFLWGLDDDAAAHHAAMASDPDLAPLLLRFGALRILRAPDVYECLLIAIIGQQVSVQAAQAIRRRLMEHMGTRITVAGVFGEEQYALLPTPLQLIEAGENALRAQGVSRQKAVYLMGIAHRALAGELDRPVFAALSDEETLDRLCEIKGVGRWTAEIVLMFGLGRHDIFPAGDLGLQAAVQQLLGLSERLPEKTVRKIAERWAGWRSYAALYLWTSI
ncbi:MAG: DNA-3-methyladenine glycosylase, partial [Syntrophales bacterium]|nr:DNA-3-methyladenine glycosylase [Syntrophales bacterium]